MKITLVPGGPPLNDKLTGWPVFPCTNTCTVNASDPPCAIVPELWGRARDRTKGPDAPVELVIATVPEDVDGSVVVVAEIVVDVEEVVVELVEVEVVDVVVVVVLEVVVDVEVEDCEEVVEVDGSVVVDADVEVEVEELLVDDVVDVVDVVERLVVDVDEDELVELVEVVVVVVGGGVSPLLVRKVLGLFASQLLISCLNNGLSQSWSVLNPETPVKYWLGYPSPFCVPSCPPMKLSHWRFDMGLALSCWSAWSMVGGKPVVPGTTFRQGV